jgi:hypothetical protein
MPATVFGCWFSADVVTSLRFGLSDTQEFLNATPDCPNPSPVSPSFGQARVTCFCRATQPWPSVSVTLERVRGCPWLRH